MANLIVQITNVRLTNDGGRDFHLLFEPCIEPEKKFHDNKECDEILRKGEYFKLHSQMKDLIIDLNLGGMNCLVGQKTYCDPNNRSNVMINNGGQNGHRIMELRHDTEGHIFTDDWNTIIIFVDELKKKDYFVHMFYNHHCRCTQISISEKINIFDI